MRCSCVNADLVLVGALLELELVTLDCDEETPDEDALGDVLCRVLFAGCVIKKPRREDCVGSDRATATNGFLSSNTFSLSAFESRPTP